MQRTLLYGGALLLYIGCKVDTQRYMVSHTADAVRWTQHDGHSTAYIAVWIVVWQILQQIVQQILL